MLKTLGQIYGSVGTGQCVQPAIVQLLANDDQCDINFTDTVGNTPLHTACRYGHLHIVKFLLSKEHCQVNAQSKTPLHIVDKPSKGGTCKLQAPK